ncbi:hypothetical protein FO519_006353 [Halicephalobus sp. NKZ332]|nr:hypothetical protein FO519_006353 [Halicephalobus sp. NKZ332]
MPNLLPLFRPGEELPLFLRRKKESAFSSCSKENKKEVHGLPVPDSAKTKEIDEGSQQRQVAEPRYPQFKGPQNEKQKAVVGAMKHAWNGYKKFAWGKDQLMPITGKSQEWMGCGLTIIDALDTLVVMGLDEEFAEAKKWIETELDFDKDKYVSLFETTIRVLGGLLSTYHITGERLFLTKAEDIGSRLIGGMDSPSAIPFSDVNLRTKSGKSPPWGGESSLSEVTSIQLEFRALSRALNNDTYEKASFKVSEHIHNLGCKGHQGLCEMFLSPTTGKFRPGTTITLGARSDSYYEYLLKQWLQTGKTISWLREDYEESINGIKNLLWKYSEPSKLAFPVCFLAGTLALGSKNGFPEEHMDMARNLSKSCRKMYDTATELGPEIVYFNELPGVKEDITIKPLDAHCLLRPEAFEAWFYMYRFTGDKMYQEWGWTAFKAIEEYAKVKNGYSSVNSVKKVPVTYRDLMESFFLAETLKYLYLLFADDQSEIPLDKYVFNTEGHIMLIYDN